MHCPYPLFILALIPIIIFSIIADYSLYNSKVYKAFVSYVPLQIRDSLAVHSLPNTPVLHIHIHVSQVCIIHSKVAQATLEKECD